MNWPADMQPLCCRQSQMSNDDNYNYSSPEEGAGMHGAVFNRLFRSEEPRIGPR